MMNQKAFQDYYPDELSHCYGCGRLNEHGLKIRSYWDGSQAVAVLEPMPYHIGIPGYVYGGLIASLIDCHCIGTASAAALQAEGRNIETSLPLRFVTASLHVDYLRPAPIGVSLEVRAEVKEIKGRKVVVDATVSAKKEVCARGAGCSSADAGAHEASKRESLTVPWRRKRGKEGGGKGVRV